MLSRHCCFNKKARAFLVLFVGMLAFQIIEKLIHTKTNTTAHSLSTCQLVFVLFSVQLHLNEAGTFKSSSIVIYEFAEQSIMKKALLSGLN